MSTSILVIGKHDLLRSSLCNWLAARFPTAYIIDAATEAEGIALAQNLSPQIIILDIGFPGMSSLADILNIKTAVPATPLVVLTTYDYPAYRAEAITVGVSACLPKEAICTELQPLMAGLLSGPYQNGRQVQKELAEASA